MHPLKVHKAYSVRKYCAFFLSRLQSLTDLNRLLFAEDTRLNQAILASFQTDQLNGQIR